MFSCGRRLFAGRIVPSVSFPSFAGLSLVPHKETEYTPKREKDIRGEGVLRHLSGRRSSSRNPYLMKGLMSNCCYKRRDSHAFWVNGRGLPLILLPNRGGCLLVLGSWSETGVLCSGSHAKKAEKQRREKRAKNRLKDF